MADRLWRAQVSIPLDSAVEEDAITNTFYFDDDDDPIAGPEDTGAFIMTLLTAFYHEIDGNLYPNTIGPQATVKMYDMAEDEPRLVVFEDTIDLTPYASSLSLPNEVALVASFGADPISGQNPAMRRGRVFLGPVVLDASNVVNSQSRPAAGTINSVVAAMNAMRDGYEHPASPGYRCRWAVYSRTWHLGRGVTPKGRPAIPPHAIGEAFNDVTHGYVDNAFDTQRRRGPAPTTRTSFT